MGFAAGFKAGKEAVESLRSRWDTEDKNKALTKIGADAEVVEGERYTVTDDKGVSAEGLMTEPGVNVAQLYKEAAQRENEYYEKEGISKKVNPYKVDTTPGKAFTTRASSQDTAIVDKESDAVKAASKRNYGLAMQRAAAHQQYNDHEGAGLLMKDAKATLRQENQDMRAREREEIDDARKKIENSQHDELHNINKGTSQLQLDALQTAKKRQQDYETAIAGITETDAAKRQDAILDATRKILGEDAWLKLGNAYSERDVKQIALRSADLNESFNKAYLAGPKAVIQWYDDNNGSAVVKYMEDPITKAVRMIDGNGKVLIEGATEQELMQKLYAMKTPEGLINLAAKQADARKTEAEIAKLNAQTEEAKAKAAEALRPVVAGGTAKTANVVFSAVDKFKLDSFQDDVKTAKAVYNNATATPEEKKAALTAADAAQKKINAILATYGDKPADIPLTREQAIDAHKNADPKLKQRFEAAYPQYFQKPAPTATQPVTQPAQKVDQKSPPNAEVKPKPLTWQERSEERARREAELVAQAKDVATQFVEKAQAKINAVNAVNSTNAQVHKANQIEANKRRNEAAAAKVSLSKIPKMPPKTITTGTPFEPVKKPNPAYKTWYDQYATEYNRLLRITNP
jgi:hypothetical protein